MLHALSEKIAVFLFDNNDKYPIDVYIYGIELTLSSFVGMLVVLLVGLVSGYLIESIIFMVSLSTSASSSILYNGSGSITCKVTASSGFPLGTTSNTVTGTNTYCEVYEAFNYDAKCSLAGTVTCSKANCSGTVYVNVEAY